MRRVVRIALALAALGSALPAWADDPPLSPEEARARWRERLAGRHFTSSVELRYRYGQKREERVLSVWRDDDPDRGERLMARFESPPDLRGFGLLYLEHEARPNDYFVYQPATQRVRRISETTANEDIYGVDLEYLGFGVAQHVHSRPQSVQVVSLDGREVYRLEERALEGNQRFDRRVAFLDPETFLPLRVEHRRGDATVLVATTEEVEVVQGVPTPVRTRFVRPREGTEVVMEVASIDYQKPIPGAFFSTLALVKR